MLGAASALLWNLRPSLTGAVPGRMDPRRRRRRLLLATSGVAVIALCGAAASAQTTYGLIEGRITDATGGALPGATITVRQPTTGFARTVVSNDLGLYRMLYLSPAEYDLTVERSGFATVTRELVKVDVGQAVALDIGMTVGNVAVVIDVATPIAT